MNQKQFIGLLNIIVPAALSYAVGAKWIDAGDVGQITTAIVTLGAAIWTIYAHTRKAAVATVASMDATEVSPSGKTITIVDPELAKVAKENATPPALR